MITIRLLSSQVGGKYYSNKKTREICVGGLCWMFASNQVHAVNLCWEEIGKRHLKRGEKFDDVKAITVS